MTMSDRRVHARTSKGDEVVRYERAGKWFIEYADGTRRPVGIMDAARWALQNGAVHTPGVPGGKLFDARMRAL